MDVVLITTGSRPKSLAQSLQSLVENATDWQAHHLTVVWDDFHQSHGSYTAITNWPPRQGASASRNIGASSIPTYRRQHHVMFIDDDVYMLPGWDTTLMEVSKELPDSVISGHAHPFNQPYGQYKAGDWVVDAAGVLSTVHLMMPWAIWDSVGYFMEPGGPGGSEDVEWCARAIDKGYGLAVTSPQCVVHCGLTSSSGQQIVGYDLMAAQNEALIASLGLEGKVVWG